MNRCVSVISAILTLVYATSCHSADESNHMKKNKIWLNQSLLKEAAPGMAQIWNTPIELDPQVSTIQDLWIDYTPEGEVTLDTALRDVLNFIKIKHGVSLSWRQEGNCIIIEKESEQAATRNR